MGVSSAIYGTLRHKLAVQLEYTRQALETYFPGGCRVTRPEGGYMLWIEPPARRRGPDPASARSGEANQRRAGAHFLRAATLSNFIRVNGHPWCEAMDNAVRTLGVVDR